MAFGFVFLLGTSMHRNSKHRDFKDRAFQKLALALGRVALSWNDLHISLSSLLSVILRIPNRLITDTIWYAVKSDRGQRDVLKALNSSQAIGLNLSKEARAEISWILSRATAIEDLRNDLLHSPFVNSFGNIRPLHLGVHNRAIGLETKNLLAECHWFYTTATMLRDHADKIDEALSRPNATLLKRPKLPDRPSPKKQ